MLSSWCTQCSPIKLLLLKTSVVSHYTFFCLQLTSVWSASLLQTQYTLDLHSERTTHRHYGCFTNVVTRTQTQRNLFQMFLSILWLSKTELPLNKMYFLGTVPVLYAGCNMGVRDTSMIHLFMSSFCFFRTELNYLIFVWSWKWSRCFTGAQRKIVSFALLSIESVCDHNIDTKTLGERTVFFLFACLFYR